MMKKSARVLFLRISMSTTSRAFFDSAASRTSRTNCRDVIRRDYCTAVSSSIDTVLLDVGRHRGGKKLVCGPALSQDPPDRRGRDGWRNKLQENAVRGRAEPVEETLR